MDAPLSRAWRTVAARAVVALLLGIALAAQSPAPAAVVGDAATERDGPPAEIRIGLRARAGGADRLTSLRYVGGFETKTLLLETLVRRDVDGRIVGALASSWRVEDGGRTFVFGLRPDARFHDGTAVDAAAVAAHFRRWVGHVEHDWLRVNRMIRAVDATPEGELRVELQSPYALLEDLLAINPCAVVAPSAIDWEGEFVRPIGTGPFRCIEVLDGGRRWRLEPTSGDGPRLLVTFYPRSPDPTPIDDLVRGSIDLFAGGWDEDLPPERLTALEQDPRYRLHTAPGSSVVYLSFAMRQGPTADLAIRQRIAAAVDRGELARIVEGGRADPCTTWAAPSVAFWPAGPATAKLRERATADGAAPAAATGTTTEATAAATTGATADEPVRLTVTGGRGHDRGARVAIEVVAQLRRAGFDAHYVSAPAQLPEASRIVVDAGSAVRPLTTESGEVRAAAARATRARTAEVDVRVEITHGMPYCPHQSLVARFGAPRGERDRRGGSDELQQLVEEAAAVPVEQDRIPVYARIQDLMDRQAVIVPLYSPWRVAFGTAGIEGIRLGPDVYHVDLTAVRRSR